MKKYSIFLFLALLNVGAYSQLKILDNNKIAINTESALSEVSVGGEGSSTAYMFINNNKIIDYSRGLLVTTNLGATHRYGIVGVAPAQSGGYSYGIYGSASTPTSLGSGRSYGLYGVAGNAANGYNYGVYGRLYGNANGAGVFGTITTEYYIDGKYAGYFYGNVKISGNAWINGSPVVTSDIRAKKDIRTLDRDNTSKLRQLNGLKYKLKQPHELNPTFAKNNQADSDTTNQVKLDPQMEEIYNKERIGLSAQEVQNVYPELVVEGQDGTLGIDYIGLIPVLIEAIKEQQETLESQQNEIELLKRQLNNR